MLVTADEIRSAIKEVPKRTKFIPGHTPSAVLMIFFNREGRTHIVYIRRTANMRIHSGNMAFPGGKIDPQDNSSYATAGRETHEEIGVTGDHYEHLGDMGNFETLTSKFDAVAHLAWSSQLPIYTINHDEVAEVVEIPLEVLIQQYRRDLDFNNYEELMYLNFTYQATPSSRAATLWGLTARITHHFVAGLIYYLPRR